MLDLRRIREHPEETERQLQRREPGLSLAPLLDADARHRGYLSEEEHLRARQNSVGPEIASARKAGTDASDLLAEMTRIKARVQELADLRRDAEAEVERLLLDLPNLPHATVPDSLDKHDNQVIRTWGERPAFDFAPRNHLAVAQRLGILDLERGAKVAGAGWPCYRGLGARLEWALVQFCLDRGVRDGYELILPPFAVTAAVMQSAGVLPKFQEQVYHVTRDDLYLIPTAEIVLTGLYADEILPVEKLPLKLTAYTPCFRREAGTYGATERGLMRVHQFNKVERYTLSVPDDSYALLETVTGEAEALVHELGLHHVTTLLVTGDIAQQAAKTYDIEVWLPGQGVYTEVSSASNCEDYQARRGRVRYRPAPGEGGKPSKPELVHTAGGAAAVSRRAGGHRAGVSAGRTPGGRAETGRHAPRRHRRRPAPGLARPPGRHARAHRGRLHRRRR
ncbi:MAG: serine--tRNA ligase [Armatimonadetes bacterium]|nr:serine--tRNA ligase [Armatimonadota bacterium]